MRGKHSTDRNGHLRITARKPRAPSSYVCASVEGVREEVLKVLFVRVESETPRTTTDRHAEPNNETVRSSVSDRSRSVRCCAPRRKRGLFLTPHPLSLMLGRPGDRDRARGAGVQDRLAAPFPRHIDTAFTSGALWKAWRQQLRPGMKLSSTAACCRPQRRKATSEDTSKTNMAKDARVVCCTTAKASGRRGRESECVVR